MSVRSYITHSYTYEDSHSSTVSSNTATGVIPDALLMTFQAFIKAPNGTMVKVRGLLDSASSASFISERLAHSLKLPLSNHQITIAGIADCQIIHHFDPSLRSRSHLLSYLVIG